MTTCTARQSSLQRSIAFASSGDVEGEQEFLCLLGGRFDCWCSGVVVVSLSAQADPPTVCRQQAAYVARCAHRPTVLFLFVHDVPELVCTGILWLFGPAGNE